MATKKIMPLACLLLFQLSLSAQRSYSDELMVMLNEDKLGKAMDYYACYKDSLEDELAYRYYWAMVGSFFSKPDSAIASIKAMLERHRDRVDEKTIPILYGWLWHIYYSKGDYSSAQTLLEAMVADSAAHGVETAPLQASLVEAQQYPEVEVLNTGAAESICIKIEPYAEKIFCNARYNSCSFGLNTLFDTGCDVFFIMSKKMADSIGVKILKEPSWIILNGNKVLCAQGVIDSVRIGDLLIKNAQVQVTYMDTIPDSIVDIATYSNAGQIAMGLLMMKLLNHIQVDIINGEMAVSLNKKRQSAKRSNMRLRFGFLPEETLYVISQLDSIDFTAFFDTGGAINVNGEDCDVLIGHDFYKAHEAMFTNLTGSDKSGDDFTLTALNYQYSGKYLDVPEIRLQVKDMPLDMRSKARIMLGDFVLMLGDGVIEGTVLRKFSKVTLDFYNMRVDFEKGCNENLMAMLNAKKFDEALDYYACRKDSLKGDYAYRYYWMTIGSLFNKRDSAIVSIKALLEKYRYTHSDRAMFLLYSHLLHIYCDAGKYGDALALLDSMIADSIKWVNFSESKTNIAMRQQYPDMEILNTGTAESIYIKTEQGAKITCSARYNRCSFGVSTALSTGNFAPFTMSKKMADSIGVKILEDTFWADTAHGKRGILDSVRIGALLIKNAMVNVIIPDTTSDTVTNLSPHSANSITMGLSVLKQLNRIQIDMLNGEMAVLLNKKEPISKKSNMFLNFGLFSSEETLCVMLKLDSVNFTAFFDTGADMEEVDMFIGHDFYRVHEGMFTRLT
ncbi:MAG: aspartyl protease family protein, partial [Prevotellaceae bacterium]|nr:aspartyl protease family protein [Prevotellaceae bacterium]